MVKKKSFKLIHPPKWFRWNNSFSH